MLLIMIKSLHCLEVCLQEFNLAQPKLLLSSIVGCSDELLCLAVVLLRFLSLRLVLHFIIASVRLDALSLASRSEVTLV